MPTYQERLWAPLSWAAIALGGAVLVAVSFRENLLLLAGLPALGVVALLALSRDQLRVEDGVLHVPGARAPLAAFGPAEVLDRAQLRERMGIRAHRDAWVRVKPWARAAVLLTVDDPGDDTPYWLIGTRHPMDLAVAMARFPTTRSSETTTS
jgi:hypothetical protein